VVESAASSPPRAPHHTRSRQRRSHQHARKKKGLPPGARPGAKPVTSSSSALPPRPAPTTPTRAPETVRSHILAHPGGDPSLWLARAGCKNSPKDMTVCGECGLLSDSSYGLGGFMYGPDEQ
jgi:hypothetical protein